MTEDSEQKTAQTIGDVKRNDKQGRLKDYSVILAAAIVIIGGIHCARGILGPIFIACFFAALLISPVRWLRSKGVAQWAALSFVVVGVLAIGLGTMTIVGAQLTQFAKNIPAYRDAFNEKLINYNLNVDDFLPFLKSDKPNEEPKNSLNDELTFERFREYEREHSRRAAGEADAAENSDKRSSGKRSAAEKSAPNDSDKTVAFSKNVVPIAYRWTNDEPSPSQSAPCLNLDAKIKPSFDSETGAEENASGAKKVELSSFLPPSNDAENRLTTNEVDDTERLIPTQPTPLMSVDDASNVGAADAVAELAIESGEEKRTSGSDETESGEKNVGSDGQFSGQSDETAVDEQTDEPRFEWRAGESAVSAVNASSQELFRFLAGLVGELSYLASNTFIITLLVIFMLCEGTAIPQKMVAALGKKRFTNAHIQRVADDIRNYMVIKTWMSVGVGFCVTILLIVSNVQYPLLWGFVAFLLNYIPNIGSVAAAIPPIVLATVEHGLIVGCVDATFFAVINCFFGYVVEPRLLGDGLDLSPLIVLISLILFGWLLGPIGMFLSPPLAVIIKIIFQSFPETRWIAALMANRPPKEVVDDDEVLEAE